MCNFLIALTIFIRIHVCVLLFLFFSEHLIHHTDAVYSWILSCEIDLYLRDWTFYTLPFRTQASWVSASYPFPEPTHIGFRKGFWMVEFIFILIHSRNDDKHDAILIISIRGGHLSFNALSASLGCSCVVASPHNDVGALPCAVEVSDLL